MQSLNEQTDWVYAQANRVADHAKISGNGDAFFIGMCILWAANMIADKMEEINRSSP